MPPSAALQASAASLEREAGYILLGSLCHCLPTEVRRLLHQTALCWLRACIRTSLELQLAMKPSRCAAKYELALSCWLAHWRRC